jgi:hypothetical protein
MWDELINNKLVLKDILLSQGRIESPLCPACDQFNKTIHHKYVVCEAIRNVWSYIQNIIHIHHRTRRRLTFDDIAFPVLNGLRSVDKKSVTKIFAIYLNFIEETFTVKSPKNDSIKQMFTLQELYKSNLHQEIKSLLQ